MPIVEEQNISGKEPEELSNEELLDEIARVGNYTDREMKCRKEINNRKANGEWK